ncbi:MAG: protein kinase, partial [Verrucomicrobiota bacterium]|nr:protein kinase [Verrucomicrobiota bacterium]
GTMARVHDGACLSCLLGAGLEEDDATDDEDFESAVSEIEVRDSDWRIGKYQILGEIGRGGMGVIYRARQWQSNRIVALKRVLGYHGDSRDTLERFRREAEAAASLDHPNILPIYEVGESDGLPFFTMKFAPGGSLQRAAAALSAEPRECVFLLAKVARAVAYAHKAGILHRDLKPGNILLDGHGEPLVSDFGLAKWIDATSDLTRSLAIFGTPGFIAPEQAHGPAGSLTAAADIYSLGAILFDLLTGQPPFLGEHALAVIRQAAEKPAPKLRSIAPSLDRDLETICARCLEREPAARYRSASDLADDLEHWFNGRSIIARPVSPPIRVWRWSKRNRVLAGASGTCLLLAATVVWLATGKMAHRPETPPFEKSIAVLPFENLNAATEAQFFADGMQEDILTDLGKVSDLKVVSRSSTQAYKSGVPRNLREIGATLNARYVLEGSVRRSDGRVRINAYLSDVQTGAQVWSEQYDRGVADVFAIQSEIAQEIAGQLRARLSPKEQASLQVKPTNDIVAYELYLRAKEIGRRAGLTTAERTEHQVHLLGEAISRDPAFVSAYCLLARVHVQSYWYNIDHSPERLAAAWTALETAARLQPDAGEVHLNRALLYYWGSFDYPAALAELVIARRLLPNEAEVLYFNALIERRKGDWQGSINHLIEARKMDPLNPTILFDLARTNYFATKQYREAAALCESVLSWKPDAFDFQLARAKVDVASRADLRRLHALLASDAGKDSEPQLLGFEHVELALAERDYPAAAAALTSHPMSDFNWSGYLTPRDWYRGIIARALGHSEEADAAFRAARDAVADALKKRPDDPKAHIVLADIYARMGAKEEAIREGERAHELLPVERDAVDGPNILVRLAAVYAMIGDPDHALDLLEPAAKMPGATNFGALTLENAWDSLRDNPRFRAILASLAPKPE